MNGHSPLRAAIVLLAILSGPVAAAEPSPAAIDAAEFVRKAAWSDMFETQSSELAAIRGDAGTRALAAQMNEAHQKTSSELGLIVKGRADELPLPPRLDAAGQRRIDRLREQEGGDFRQQYVRDQIEAHEAAVRLLTGFASNGESEPLRAWAAQTLPKLEEHLARARALQTAP